MKKLTLLFVGIFVMISSYAQEGGILTASSNPIIPTQAVTIYYDGTGTNFANWVPKCLLWAYLTPKSGETFSKNYNPDFVWTDINSDANYDNLNSQFKMTYDGTPTPPTGKYHIDIANLYNLFGVANEDKAKIDKMKVTVRSQFSSGNNNKTIEFSLNVASVTITAPPSALVGNIIPLNATTNVASPTYTYYVKTPGSAIYTPLGTNSYKPLVAGTHVFKVEVTAGGNPTVLLENEQEVLVKTAYITGDGKGNFCNNINWNPAGIQMPRVGNIYTVTFTNVEPDTYNFKITDGDWASNGGKEWGFTAFNGTAPVRDGGGAVKFSIALKSDITITFDGTNITEVTSSNGFSYFVAANIVNSWVTDVHEMKQNGNIAIYTFTKITPSKVCEFKITNGTPWADRNHRNWGHSSYTGESDQTVVATVPDNNVRFTTPAVTVAASTDAKILFDTRTGKIIDLVIGAFYCAGNFPCSDLMVGNVTWGEPVLMRGIGPASVIFPKMPDLATGSYEFRIKDNNGNWLNAPLASPLDIGSVSGASGGGAGNILFNTGTGTNSDILISYNDAPNGNSGKVNAIKALTSYTVIGSSTVFGGSPVDNKIFSANDMVWYPHVQLWVIWFKNVPAGTYYYKVVGNYDIPTYEYPDPNITPTLDYKQMVVPSFGSGESIVAITFNPVTNSLN